MKVFVVFEHLKNSPLKEVKSICSSEEVAWRVVDNLIKNDTENKFDFNFESYYVDYFGDEWPP